MFFALHSRLVLLQYLYKRKRKMFNLETNVPRTIHDFSSLGRLASGGVVIEQEGVYYPEYILPDYRDSVDPTVAIGDEEDFGGVGSSRIDICSLNDNKGTKHKVVVYRANDGQDMPWVVRGTSLSTQPEGTVNATMSQLFMRLGFNVITIGPEIGSSLPQSQSAHNMHSILDEYERKGEVDTANVLYEGYSRGANIGIGFIAYALGFKRKVACSHLTDLTLALPVDLDVEGAKKALRFPQEIASLGISVLKVLPELPKRPRVAETFDISLNGLRQFYRTLKPLMSGEAGMMATKLPLDTQALIAFYGLSSWNDRDVYLEILKNYPNIRYLNPRGRHGRGVSIRSCQAIVRAFRGIRSQILDGVPIEEVDMNQDLAIAS